MSQAQANGDKQTKSAKKSGDKQEPVVYVETRPQSVQTIESSLGPCETCAKVQANLKQNADQLINMCYYQNLTSQVGKLRTTLAEGQTSAGGWLSGADLERWLAEQDKDLGKVAKQLEFLNKNSELLKGKLVESEATIQRMLTAEKEAKKTA